MDNSPEKLGEPENKEKDSAEVLYAVGKIDSNGEQFWYVRDPEGKLSPIDTREDDDGVVREVLDDDTLGREIVQDPTDYHPDEIASMYGMAGEGSDSLERPVADYELPQDERLSTKPMNISQESPLAEGGIQGERQGYANAMSAQSNEIRDEINSLSAEGVESPAELEQSSSEYAKDIADSLNEITVSLMQKADALRGLGMERAAYYFAGKTEEINSKIAHEIEQAGDDISKLAEIRTRYFEGDPSDVLSKIPPALESDASVEKFNSLLSRVTTIPEMVYIADKLVAARNERKQEIEEEVKNAPDEATRDIAEQELEDIEMGEPEDRE